jgi:hypothetical protein
MRSRNSKKNRHYNEQKKKDERTTYDIQNITQKIKKMTYMNSTQEWG